MHRADEQVDRSFRLTHDEVREAAECDKSATDQAADIGRLYNRVQCAKYQARHKEEIAEKHKAYYAAHREARIAHQAEYVRLHREERRAYDRSRYQKKKEAAASDATRATARENDTGPIMDL